jgi:hypothetical protein
MTREVSARSLCDCRASSNIISHMCQPHQHVYLHKQTPTLTFTATPRKGAHSLVGEDPLDTVGGVPQSSHIENSSEDMQEVR